MMNTLHRRLYSTQKNLPVWSAAATATGRADIHRLLGEGVWQLASGGNAITREYHFKGFGAAMKFWAAVAAECKTAKHHPEWANVYNKVVVRWTTHNPPGLSDKDACMAAVCDQLAAQAGEKLAPALKDPESTEGEGIRSLIGQAAQGCKPCGK